jgi:uncharacterized membrane protein
VTAGRRFRGNEDGAVLPIVALSLVFLMTMTAFTIDLGRVMLSNRDLQKVSDLVALDLARRVDGVRTVTEINADPTFQVQKVISAARNGFDVTGSRRIEHQLGVIDRRTRQFYELHGSSVPNAVRVVAGDSVDYFFFPGSSSTSRGASVLGKGNPTCVSPDPDCPLVPDDSGGGGGTTTTLPGVTTTLPGVTTTLPGVTTTTVPGGGGTTTTVPGGGGTTTTLPGTTTSLPDNCLPLPTICPMTAASTDFEVGSFLAGVNLNNTQVQLLNALFSRVGTGVNLDALSYQGLANSQVTIRQLATTLGLASPNDLFTSTVTYKNFLLASASAISSNGGPAAAVSALNTLAATVNSNTTINLSGLLRRGSGFQGNQGNGPNAFDTYIKFMHMLEGSAFLVNGSNAISIPNLSLGLPGFVRVDASLTVIEAAQRMPRAHVGDALQTSQVSLTLTITLDVDLGTQRAGERLHGTMVVHPQGGSATASPTLIVCPNTPGPVPPQVRVSVVSSPVTTTGNAAMNLSIGVVNVMSVNIPSASITSAGQTGTATFLYPSEFLPSVGSGGMKRVANPSLNLAGGFNATASNSAVVGLPLVPFATLVSETNAGLAAAVFAPLQNTVVPLITGTLGIELGGADVGVFGIECTETLLVH